MVLLLVFICGCNTPYTGDLGPEDFNGWIESEENGLVCLWNGFDKICIYTIEGPQGIIGPRGPQGIQGIQGPQGVDGMQGIKGIDGAVIYLELEKIVTEIEFVEVPVIEKEIFVLYVSQTDTIYFTPLGEVYVPESGPIVVPYDVVVNHITTDPTSKLDDTVSNEEGTWIVEFWAVDIDGKLIKQDDVGPGKDPGDGSQYLKADLYVYRPGDRNLTPHPSNASNIQFQGSSSDVNEDVNKQLTDEGIEINIVSGVQGIVN